VLVLVLGLFACGDDVQPSASLTPDRLVVDRGELAREVLLTGELVAEEAAVLAGPSVGVWPLQIRWVADDGASVQADDPVVEFDNSQLLSNLEERRLTVVEAVNRLTTLEAEAAARETETRFAVNQAEARLATARLDAAIPDELLPVWEVDRRHLELQRAELGLAQAERELANQRQVSEAGLEMQRVALARSRSEVTQAEDGIAQLTLRAPRAGIVNLARNPREDRTFESGDSAWPGLVVARLPELGTLAVEARLFDVDDGLVAPGLPVTASLDALPEDALSGRVRSVDPFAQDAGWRSQRRFFRTIVDLERLDPARMLPGMSVKVAVHLPSLETALLVPRRCLEWAGEGPRAVLAGGRRAPVSLGPCNSSACVVTGGLDLGARLGLP
jgi:hypothetical protein